MTFYTRDGFYYNGMDKETIVRLRKELNQETIFIEQNEYESILQNTGK